MEWHASSIPFALKMSKQVDEIQVETDKLKWKKNQLNIALSYKLFYFKNAKRKYRVF